MTQKQAKKQTEKVYRSIEEFKEHFFPNFYKEELAKEKKTRSQTFWDWFDTRTLGEC